jgi:hypothetical protein
MCKVMLSSFFLRRLYCTPFFLPATWDVVLFLLFRHKQMYVSAVGDLITVVALFKRNNPTIPEPTPGWNLDGTALLLTWIPIVLAIIFQYATWPPPPTSTIAASSSPILPSGGYQPLLPITAAATSPRSTRPPVPASAPLITPTDTMGIVPSASSDAIPRIHSLTAVVPLAASTASPSP